MRRGKMFLSLPVHPPRLLFVHVCLSTSMVCLISLLPRLTCSPRLLLMHVCSSHLPVCPHIHPACSSYTSICLHIIALALPLIYMFSSSSLHTYKCNAPASPAITSPLSPQILQIHLHCSVSAQVSRLALRLCVLCHESVYPKHS